MDHISPYVASLCDFAYYVVSTSPAFMRSIDSYPADPYGRLAQKTVIGTILLGAGGVDTIFYFNMDISRIYHFFSAM